QSLECTTQSLRCGGQSLKCTTQSLECTAQTLKCTAQSLKSNAESLEFGSYSLNVNSMETKKLLKTAYMEPTYAKLIACATVSIHEKAVNQVSLKFTKR